MQGLPDSSFTLNIFNISSQERRASTQDYSLSINFVLLTKNVYSSVIVPTNWIMTSRPPKTAFSFQWQKQVHHPAHPLSSTLRWSGQVVRGKLPGRNGPECLCTFVCPYLRIMQWLLDKNHSLAGGWGWGLSWRLWFGSSSISAQFSVLWEKPSLSCS